MRQAQHCAAGLGIPVHAVYREPGHTGAFASNPPERDPSLRRQAGAVATPASGPPPTRNYDMTKVLQNGIIGFGTMASTFGFFVGGLGGIARAQTRLGPRLVASLAPVAAGGASAYLERGLERVSGFGATPMPVRTDRADRHGLIYHGILPSCFMFFNLSYALSSITKHPPASLRGLATVIAVSGAGSFCGKAGMELYAQDLRLRMHYGQQTPPPRPDVDDTAAARALTQIPAAIYGAALAAVYRGRSIPRPLLLGLPVVIGLTYAQRGVVLGALRDGARQERS